MYYISIYINISKDSGSHYLWSVEGRRANKKSKLEKATESSDELCKKQSLVLVLLKYLYK